MSIAVIPKYIEDYPLNDLSAGEFLVLALDAATQLDLNVTYVSQSGFIAYTHKRSAFKKAKIEVRIINGVATLKSASVGNGFFDYGRNKKIISALLSAFYELRAVATAEDLSTKITELIESGKLDENDVLNTPPPPLERLTGFAGMFKPTKGYFITPIIIDINILLFICMVASGVSLFSPDTDSLLRWGADFRPYALEGQWWRLVTSMFLHIGILHLVMNMFALVYIGLLLEPYLGRARFLAAYFLTGIAASVASLCWHEYTVSAGASGAIFGMYGVFLALLTSNVIEKATRKALLTSIAVFVGYNLLSGMKPGVDNSAHLGGLVSGMVIGYAFIPSLKRPGANNIKFVTILLLSAFILTAAAVVYKKIPDDVAIYDTKMKAFFETETVAVNSYESAEKNMSKEDFANELRTKGISYWQKDLDLVVQLDKLNLPAIVHRRDRFLKKYCSLRIQTYGLLCKKIDEDTYKYDDQINDCDAQINAIMDSLAVK